MKIRLLFAWYDMWVGAYWDRKTQTLYLCPLPMIVIRIQLTATADAKRKEAKD